METPIPTSSKFLSLVLRHQPHLIGLSLDEQGWASVEELLHRVQQSGRELLPEQLQSIVANCPKQRFRFSEDGLRIRANQGHSLPIELGLAPQVPPQRLYHGTAEATLESIRQQGLLRQSRHHVHLSSDPISARTVGMRHGKPRVLGIRALQMHQNGHLFYQSDNGVWLTETVPVEYLEFI
jgi:putative RNA 2'-phosphotransferase